MRESFHHTSFRNSDIFSIHYNHSKTHSGILFHWCNINNHWTKNTMRWSGCVVICQSDGTLQKKNSPKRIAEPPYFWRKYVRYACVCVWKALTNKISKGIRQKKWSSAKNTLFQVLVKCCSGCTWTTHCIWFVEFLLSMYQGYFAVKLNNFWNTSNVVVRLSSSYTFAVYCFKSFYHLLCTRKRIVTGCFYLRFFFYFNAANVFFIVHEVENMLRCGCVCIVVVFLWFLLLYSCFCWCIYKM